MLKITKTDSPDEQRWSLQGQLVGQWAAEFESTWREARRAGDTRRCMVELIEGDIHRSKWRSPSR